MCMSSLFYFIPEEWANQVFHACGKSLYVLSYLKHEQLLIAVQVLCTGHSQSELPVSLPIQLISPKNKKEKIALCITV